VSHRGGITPTLAARHRRGQVQAASLFNLADPTPPMSASRRKFSSHSGHASGSLYAAVAAVSIQDQENQAVTATRAWPMSRVRVPRRLGSPERNRALDPPRTRGRMMRTDSIRGGNQRCRIRATANRVSRRLGTRLEPPETNDGRVGTCVLLPDGWRTRVAVPSYET
jgi:hypothetical protein